MDSKAIIFSVIALFGTGGLLWAGFSGGGNERGEDDEHEHEVYEYRYQQAGEKPDDSQEHEQARVLQQQGEILSLEQILERARAHHEGRILEAELKRKRDAYEYEVELVDARGQVWEMKFDAISGELLEEDREK